MHLKPLFADLEEDFGKPAYTWTHINVQDESLRSQKMNVMQIPCMVVFKNGKEVGRHVGTDAARYYAILRAAGKA
jgi:thioredoxin-like negative regulator of GroEL